MKLNEGVRRLKRLAKSKKLGHDSLQKDFSSAQKKVARRNDKAIRKYGQAKLANMRLKGHEISKNTREVSEGVRRVDRLALSTRAPMSAFRKAMGKLSRRNAKYFEKNKKEAGPGIDLKPKSFPKKRVAESFIKIGKLIAELNKYEAYKNKKFKEKEGKNLSPDSIRIGRRHSKTGTSWGDPRNYSVDPLGPKEIEVTKAKRNIEAQKAKKGQSIKHNLFKLKKDHLNKRVQEGYEKLYSFLNEMKKYEDYLNKKKTL